MERHEKFIERGDLKGATHIQVSILYGKNRNPRGYYLSVTPVTKKDGMVSYSLFSGISKLLFETKRYTAKQFEQAITEAAKYEDELVAAVAEKNKIA